MTQGNRVVNHVERSESGFVVPAEILAEAFGLDPAAIPQMMRAGAITSLSEAGHAEDAGRHRLTFFHDEKAFRLTVDAGGRILSRSRFDAPGRGHAGDDDMPDRG